MNLQFIQRVVFNVYKIFTLSALKISMEIFVLTSLVKNILVGDFLIEMDLTTNQ